MHSTQEPVIAAIAGLQGGDLTFHTFVTQCKRELYYRLHFTTTSDLWPACVHVDLSVGFNAAGG